MEANFKPMLEALAPKAEPAKPAAVAEENLYEAAEKLESAFVTQLLKYSGFSDAFTQGAGDSAEAYSTFYLEQFTEKIMESGGFGLAGDIHERLIASGALEDDNS